MWLGAVEVVVCMLSVILAVFLLYRCHRFLCFPVTVVFALQNTAIHIRSCQQSQRRGARANENLPITGGRHCANVSRGGLSL